MLVTGGVDGLVCTFDATQAREEEALQAVLPVDDSVAAVGLFGPAGRLLHAATDSRGLSLWRLEESECIAAFPDVREALAAQCRVEYLVACAYDAVQHVLFLLCGDGAGALHLCCVGEGGRLQLLRSLQGHSDVVRALHWDTAAGVLLTAGEDSRLSLWTAAGDERWEEGPSRPPSRPRSKAHRAAPY